MTPERPPPPSGPASWVRSLLAHPLTRGLPLDDPRTTAARRRIVREGPFLRRVYEDWYRRIAGAVPPPDRVPGQVLEVGSGAGFLEETGLLPGLITSDALPVPGVQLVVDARRLPFDAGALRAVVMTNVLHHIPEPRRFLCESARCVRPGGVMTMIEPWVSPWSRLVYRSLHHEPFLPDAGWDFPSTGPLSGANGALPWILFSRDRARFERELPQWRIHAVRPFMPLRYLLSGGVSMRPLMPGWAHPFWTSVESLLTPLHAATAMFAHITLVRTAVPCNPSAP